MQKNFKFLLKLLPLALMSALTVFSLAGCPSGGSSPPEFVGTWKGVVPGTSPTPFTVTLAETTFSVLAGDPSGDSESLTGTITFDTSAKHILLLVATESYTGWAPTTPTLPGDKLYVLYSLSGTTLTIAFSKTAYPADLTGGIALTKQ